VKECFLRGGLTAAAKAVSENKPVTAAEALLPPKISREADFPAVCSRLISDDAEVGAVFSRWEVCHARASG
jgi:hypothetical protein